MFDQLLTQAIRQLIQEEMALNPYPSQETLDLSRVVGACNNSVFDLQEQVRTLTATLTEVRIQMNKMETRLDGEHEAFDIGAYRDDLNDIIDERIDRMMDEVDLSDAINNALSNATIEVRV